jgi:cytochrome c-type biogenesis protein CcmH
MYIFVMQWVAASSINFPFYFSNARKTEVFNQMLHNYRCVACASQSLADSNSPVAEDLRKWIYIHYREGYSVKWIDHELQTRYGDRILLEPNRYKHPLLWLLPLLTFLALMYYWVRNSR